VLQYDLSTTFRFPIAAFPHVDVRLIYLLFTQRRKRATLQLKLAYIASSVLMPVFLEKLIVNAATLAEDVSGYHLLYGW
jgi:hypothetical protein